MIEEKTQQTLDTKDYGKFSFIESNRPTNRRHVQELINSFTENPQTARLRPILVNEYSEIIDGQHRFLAWQAMGLPIYYVVEPKLTIQDAQRLNNTQKNWSRDDYARSYAMEGNIQYQKYLEYKAEYSDLSGSTITLYCQGYKIHAQETNFRKGKFKLMKDHKTIENRLSMLAELNELLPQHTKTSFAKAMLTVFKSDQYDHDRFLEKMKSHGGRELENFNGTHNDWLRAIENVYNKWMPEEKMARFFG